MELIPNARKLNAYRIGLQLLAKKLELRGKRGDFERWWKLHGYKQSQVSRWMKMAKGTYGKPSIHKMRITRDDNGAAFRARPMQNPEGFIPVGPGKKLSDFDVDGAQFSPTTLVIQEGISEAEWIAIGRRLSTVQGSSLWWIGDWVGVGFETFGKTVAYNLAQQATGMGRGSLYSYRTVAKHFCPARRVPELTFKHHAVVATPRLSDAQQDELLRDAVLLGLSPRQLRDEVEKLIGKQKRERIKVAIYLWPDTFVKLKELSLGKRVEWFAAQIIEEYVQEAREKEEAEFERCYDDGNDEQTMRQ
jgi:hypothetical protein